MIPASKLAQLLRDAQAAHAVVKGHNDAEWPEFYAEFILSRLHLDSTGEIREPWQEAEDRVPADRKYSVTYQKQGLGPQAPALPVLPDHSLNR